MEFKSFEEAACVALKTEQGSEEWQEAMSYAVLNGPPEFKERFDEAFRRSFPDCKPAYYDAAGNPYFTREQMKATFKVSDEEIDEVAEKHPEVRGDAGMMIRVQ